VINPRSYFCSQKIARLSAPATVLPSTSSINTMATCNPWRDSLPDQPGTNAASNLTVAKVRYSDAAPWPVSAVPLGSSFQLVDSSRDNWRAGNWSSLPQWVYVTATGPAPSSTLYIYLQSAGDTYLDDIKLVPGNVAEAGTNILAEADFESVSRVCSGMSPRIFRSGPDLAIKHSGNASLHVVSTSAGSSQGTAIWQTRQPR